MKVLELFAGTRSISKAFENHGHQTFSIEWDRSFEDIDICRDVMEVPSSEILERFGRPDVIWASPDCTTYSVSAISRHRRKNAVGGGNLSPTSKYAIQCDRVNQYIHGLIMTLSPALWFIENPVGG